MFGTWSIIEVSEGTVVMPQAADDYDISLDAVVEHSGIDGGQEAVTSKYLKLQQLSLSGELFSGTYDNSYLINTYLTPLKNMMHRKVTFSTDDSQFSGTWLFLNASFKHNKEYVLPVSYKYTLNFEKGVTINDLFASVMGGFDPEAFDETCFEHYFITG